MGIAVARSAHCTRAALHAPPLIFDSELGFISASHDEYARTLIAADWARQPFLFENESGWLPGHFYLLGLALKVHYDLFLVPRLLTVGFAVCSLFLLYLLTRHLFNRWVALLATWLAGSLPLYIYLSLTPLSDVIYYCCVLGFLYALVRWEERHAARWLLAAVAALLLANSLRYEGWFVTLAFYLYLAIHWIRGVLATRTLQPLLLLCLVGGSIPPIVWLLRQYMVQSDHFFFLQSFLPTGSSEGLYFLLPNLGYMALMIREGGLLALLAAGGIVLARPHLGRTLPIYLITALTPLALLTLFTSSVGPAYPPRFVGQYLVALAPFSAYFIWRCTIAAQQHIGNRALPMAVWFMLYNLAVVALAWAKADWRFITLVATLGIGLFFWLLPRRSWTLLSLSLLPLPLLFLGIKGGLLDANRQQYVALYALPLLLGYLLLWRQSRSSHPAPPAQWRVLGLGMLLILSLANLWGAFSHLPRGMPAGSEQMGLLVRTLYDEGTLREEDKVLVEVEEWNFLALQVLSNRPENFILDRYPEIWETRLDSFLHNPAGAPWAVGESYIWDYVEQPNPFALSPAPSWAAYSEHAGIHLVIIHSEALAEFFDDQRSFRPIARSADYTIYLSSERTHNENVK